MGWRGHRFTMLLDTTLIEEDSWIIRNH
jgi:hypothetical protein